MARHSRLKSRWTSAPRAGFSFAVSFSSAPDTSVAFHKYADEDAQEFLPSARRDDL